jgi:hypothetical protein
MTFRAYLSRIAAEDSARGDLAADALADPAWTGHTVGSLRARMRDLGASWRAWEVMDEVAEAHMRDNNKEKP